MLFKSIKRLYLIDLSIDQLTKNWRFRKSAGRFCFRILQEYCSSPLPAQAYKMIITTVCIQIDNYFCNTWIVVDQCALLIWYSWHAFVSHLGMNIFENKTTSFQWLLMPIMDHKLSVNMIWIEHDSHTVYRRNPRSRQSVTWNCFSLTVGDSYGIVFCCITFIVF